MPDHIRVTMPIALAITLLLLFPMSASSRGPAAGPASRTVEVDCTQGGSLTRALGTPARELTLVIHGLCRESVEIRRDHLLLRGSDPQVDGIAPPAGGTLIIRDARHVSLEGLSVRTVSAAALTVRNAAAVEVTGCTLAGGGVIAHHADLRFTDVGIDGGSTPWGPRLFGGSLVCTRCTITGFRLATLYAAGAGVVQIADSTLAGGSGITVRRGSRVIVEGSTVSGHPWYAGGAYNGGFLELDGSTVEGYLETGLRGSLVLADTLQTTNPYHVNLASGASDVTVAGTSELLGDLHVEGFATAVLSDGVSVDGGLYCGSGGDAFCASTVSVSGGSTCGRCPAP